MPLYNILISGITLRYCHPVQSLICCSQTMELKLVSQSKTQLEKSAKESIQKLTTILKIRAQKFNGKIILSIKISTIILRFIFYFFKLKTKNEVTKGNKK